MTEPYELQVSPSAAQVIQDKLPEGAAAAVVEFITGTLLDNPYRVGKALRRELAGVYSARRGAFCVLSEVDEGHREVTVLRVDHRADVYRPR